MRFQSRASEDQLCVEVEFTGPQFGEAISDSSQCTLKSINQEAPPGADVLWAVDFGDLEMPEGAWLGIKLVEAFQDRIFVALSSKVMEICAPSEPTIGEIP